MDEEEIEKAVVAYLKKKGFKQTEIAFQEEQQLNKNSSSSIHNNNSANSQIDPDLTKKILSFSEFETGPQRYQEEYSKLRSWAYSSLDLYKHELLRVLYPVFIHCFMELVARGHIQEARAFFNSYREDHEMTHLRDLQKLEGVLSPSHLEEMEFAHSIRLSKVNIKMCQYSYDLLLQYLHKTESITMLGIINERINFQVSPGQPGSISDDAEVVTLVASGHDASLINQKEVHWGCVQWHANCNYIATGSSDKTVRLWDVQSGDCVRIFIGHRSMILSLAMSPDGRYMASGDEDGTVMMWDLSSGRCITPLVGHSSCVWSLAFSGEGSLLASGSADCTVKLWDVTTSTKAPLKEENKSGSNNRLRLLKTLPTKATPVYALHFSRRNLLFAAGAFSKSA
ncbi:transcription initiation factor TFIID subunit 5-like [Solanum stenotomum]|uniref:transcription initiation factor TFIID subunit 5-like n=1 Tax=Solanum stenotomum TaxID=172797 RepID=UPI0020D06CCD|nr:transcription initiation factor TFIID subunit 5-like [Solanum stenotomum]